MGKIYPKLFFLLVITLILLYHLPYPVSPSQQKKLQIKEISLLWSSPRYSSDPYGLNVADLYRNGSIEILFASGSTIYCLNGRDGSQIWEYHTSTGKYLWNYIAVGDLNGDGILDAVAGASDLNSKSVFAVNGINGSQLWKADLKGSNVSTYVSLSDVNEDCWLEVLVGDSDGTFYALNGSNGVILWEYEINGSIKMYAPPAVGDLDNDGKNEVIFFGGDGYAYALNGEDGSLLWRFRAGQQVLSSAALADVDDDGRLEVIFGAEEPGRIYSRTGYIYALNGEDGSILWKQKIEGQREFKEYEPDFSSPALGDIDGDGKLEIIFGSNFGWIFALNSEDGSILWKYYDWYSEIVYGSPLIADLNGDNQLDVLFSDFDFIIALNGKNRTRIWSYGDHPSGYCMPTIAYLDNDGRLDLIVSYRYTHELLAFRISGAGFRAYWPRAYGDEKHTGNIIDVDQDLDGLSDVSEKHMGTDPNNSDMDNDGMPDGWEVAYGLNATNPIDAGLDPDNDTLTNLEEYHLGTDPLSTDTDGDGIPDAKDNHPTVYDKSLAEYLGEIAPKIYEVGGMLLAIAVVIFVIWLYAKPAKQK